MHFGSTTLKVSTHGKGVYDITSLVASALSTFEAGSGHLVCLCQHTTASLAMLGGVDERLKRDLVLFLEKLAPEDGDYSHNNTGDDDMPSHIKSVLTLPSVSATVLGGELYLGRYQGLFMLEHRTENQIRSVSISFLGTTRNF